MIGEIWTYKATKPSDNLEKIRPVLVIGDDGDNGLEFVDINYVIISSSASCGKYDVEINEETAKYIGLKRPSVIKTTKIYTGSRQKLGCKIGDLTDELKKKYFSCVTSDKDKAVIIKSFISDEYKLWGIDTIKKEDKELLISGSWAKKSIVIKRKKIKILYFKNLRHTDKCFAPHGQLLGLLFAY